MLSVSCWPPSTLWREQRAAEITSLLEPVLWHTSLLSSKWTWEGAGFIGNFYTKPQRAEKVVSKWKLPFCPLQLALVNGSSCGVIDPFLSCLLIVAM